MEFKYHFSYSVTNLLILISICITLLFSLDIEILKSFYYVNYYNSWEYILYVIQVFLSHFIYNWFFELIFYSMILLYIWNTIENYIGKVWYIWLIIFYTLVLSFMLTMFGQWFYTGMWLFLVSLLSASIYILYHKWDNEYKWYITLLVIVLFYISQFHFFNKINLIVILIGLIYWVYIRNYRD